MQYLTKILTNLRQSNQASKHNPNKVALFDPNHGAYFDGKSVKRVIIELYSSGCEWALVSGGCSMCGQIAATSKGRKVLEPSFLRQIENVFEEKNFKDYPVVCIYNSGSFYNEKEFPAKSRRALLNILAQNDDIKKIIVETRPEFITKEKIQETKRVLHEKTVEVGIGLETSNDLIRNHCINKGFSLKQFELGAEKVKEDLNLLVYVLLKSPFLTEKEGIRDTLTTIEYAKRFGSNAISVEPVSIHSGTIVDLLCKYNLWRLPWLWSVLEVAVEAIDLLESEKTEIRFGGYEFLPRPILTAHNGIDGGLCPNNCNMKIKEALKTFNLTYRKAIIKDVQQNLDCSCKFSWERDLLIKEKPLELRIEEMLLKLDSLLIEKENLKNK